MLNRTYRKTMFSNQINKIVTGIMSAAAPQGETFLQMAFLTDVDIIKIFGTKTTMMQMRNTSPDVSSQPCLNLPAATSAGIKAGVRDNRGHAAQRWRVPAMTLRAVMMTVLLVPVLLLPAQAATQDPAEVVRNTSTQVINRLRADKKELEADPGRLYELVNKLVTPHFDFVSMSRWVLGKNTWTSATEQQRQAFIEQFKTLLVRTYAKALLQYTDEQIKYYPAEGNAGSSLKIVKTEVQQPGGTGNILIQYRMHLQDGEWKVVDVVVDATSLIITFRGEYSSLVQKIGLDALIDRIAEKNNQLVSTNEAQ